jgi:hypothetical protein
MNHTPAELFTKVYAICQQIIRLSEDDTKRCHELDVVAQDARYVVQELDTYTPEQINYLRTLWTTHE